MLRRFEPQWFVAGGWAIDLFLGKEIRLHEDIEIAIFRQDQLNLQKYLSGWTLKKAENHKLFDWQPGEFLGSPIHEIHCFNERADPPFLEVLFNERNAEEWIFRRNSAVTKPLSETYLTSETGIKFLCPEAVLLYKSKNPRAKDEQDFQAVIDKLDAGGKKWLKNALAICYDEHHWLDKV